MKANTRVKTLRKALLCTILFVVVAGCSPIVRVPEPSESVPLQSVEEYERNEAMKILEQVDVGDNPVLANMLEVAKAELTEEDKSLGLTEGDDGPILPGELFIASGAEVAGGGDGSTIVEQVFNALFTFDFPAVGAVLRKGGTGSGYFETWCTATLIGCDTVLTAAHCVAKHTPSRPLKVFFQNAGVVDVTEVHIHPDYAFPQADIAVLRLAHAVDGIRPETINKNDPVETDVKGLIIGFGRTSDTRFDYGLKRYGLVTTSSCQDIPDAGLTDETQICWDFKGKGSNTCKGDSGGPLLTQVTASGIHISGITSGGSGSCAKDSSSFDARVSRYATWVDETSGGFNTDRCGQLPSVYDAGVSVQGASGNLITMTQGLHSFNVLSGTQLLRVTLNGEDPLTGSTNFDLYVKAATVPTTTNFDCRAAEPWQYEICEIPNPPPGQWFAVVNRISGTGSYQIVATTFGTAVNRPGTETGAVNLPLLDNPASPGECDRLRGTSTDSLSEELAQSAIPEFTYLAVITDTTTLRDVVETLCESIRQ